MFEVITTRNGNPIQHSTFGDYHMADYHFLLESNRAFEDPAVTVTLRQGHHALRMVSNGKPWETELFDLS